MPPDLSEQAFLALRLLHGEGEILVDRTTGRTTNGDGVRSVCGVVESLSPFGLAYLFAPTAASISISGRVSDALGLGIPNVRITITAPDGVSRSALTSSFGYYQFEDIPSGHSYLLEAAAKRFVFEPSTRVVNAVDNITDLDFVSGPIE